MRHGQKLKHQNKEQPMEPNRQNNDNKQPVMDVQRPVSNSNGQNQVIHPNNSSLNKPATMEYTRPRQEGEGSKFTAQSRVPMDEPDNPKKEKKSKKLMATILIAIGVLGVVGAAVFFYIGYQNEEPAPVATPEPVVQDDGVQATPEGVDQTIAEIDQALNSLDDTADFKPNDLSDDSLGL